ncbi:MAG: HEAT repeat domain-containing protein [bacterium]
MAKRALIIFFVLLMFSPIYTYAYLPGPNIIKRCPHCGQLIIEGSAISGNTFGAQFWTDGKVEAAMLPGLLRLVGCPGCSSFFWLDEAQVIDNEELSNETIKSYIIPSKDDYYSLLDHPPKDLAKEKYIRIRAWWASNDERRNNKDTKAINLSGQAVKNLESLYDLLSNKDPEDRLTKAEVARELGQFEGALRLLDFPFPNERAQDKIAIKYLVINKETMVKKREAIIEEVFKNMGMEALPLLLDGINPKGDFYRIRELFMSMPTRLGKTAVDQIIKILTDDSNPVLQTKAAYALGKLKIKKAVLPLIQALKAKDWIVRESAAIALGQLGDSQAVDALIMAINDKSIHVRAYSVQALGIIKNIRAFEPLIATLKDDNIDLKIYTLNALIELGDLRAVEPIIPLLKDKNCLVQNAAAKILGWFKDPRAVEPLLLLLNDENIIVEIAAIKALGMIKDCRAVKPLIEMLKREDYFIKTYASFALGELGDPLAIEGLIKVHKQMIKLYGDYEYAKSLQNILFGFAACMGEVKDITAVEEAFTAYKREIIALKSDDEDTYVASIFAYRTLESALWKLEDPIVNYAYSKANRLANGNRLQNATEALGKLKAISTVGLLKTAFRDKDVHRNIRNAAKRSLKMILGDDYEELPSERKK